MGLKSFVKSVVKAPVKIVTKTVDTGVGLVKDTAKAGVGVAKDLVGAGTDVVKDVAKTGVDVVEGALKSGVKLAEGTIKSVGNVANIAVDTVDKVVEKVVDPVVEKVVNTIKYALDNPVEATVMIVASSGPWAPWAVPAASAAITVSHGGSLADGAKAAAVAYATQEFMSNTEVGKDIGTYTKTTGAEAGTASGASAANAAIISKGVTSSLNGAIIGGLKAVITGKDIGEGITQGGVAGGAYGATDQYFANLYKEGAFNYTDDPKLNQKIAKSMGAVSGAALGAALTNKDPVTAVGNYLAYKLMDTANTEIAAAAKSTYKSMADSFKTVEEKEKDFLARQKSYNDQFADLDKRSDNYNDAVTAYQKKITDEWSPVQKELDAQKLAYDDAIKNYKAQELIYNDTSRSVDERNAAAKNMETYANNASDASKTYDKIFDNNKSLYTELNNTGDSLKSTKTTLDSDFAALQKDYGTPLTTSKTDFEDAIADYNTKKTKAEEADSAYQNQIAEAVTRDIAIDSINSGLVAPVKTNADGSVEFENGITLRSDGTMYQGDKKLFTTVEDVDQNELRFANEQGKNIWFDNTATRLASDTDVQDVYKNNYGLDVTPEEAMKFAGKKYDEADNDEVKDYAIDKIGSEFEKYGYKAPDEETLASYIQKGGDTLAKTDEVIDPYYVEEQEAKEFVRNTLGREATPEEIAMLAGTKLESESLGTRSAEEARMYDTLVKLFGAADASGYGFGTDVAGPSSLAGALPAKVFASEAGMPLTGESATDPVQEEGGIYRRTVTGKRSDGEEYSYDITFDPVTQKLRYETSGFADPENPVFGQSSVSATRPDFAEGDPQLGIYTPDEKTESELYNESALKMFLESVFGGSPSTTATTPKAPTDTTTPTTPTTPTAPTTPTTPTIPPLVDFPLTTPKTTGAGSGAGTATTPSTGGGTSGATGTGTGTGATAGTGAGTNAGTGAGTGTGSGTGTGAGGTGTGTGSGGTGTGGTGTGTGSGTSGGFGDLSSYMTGALTLGALPGVSSAITPIKPSVLTSKDPGTKFEGALEQFQEFASKPFYDENTYAEQFAQPQQTPQEEPEFMNTPYYNYGELDDVEDILNFQNDEQPTQYAAKGGLMAAPLMATGGMTGTRHGQYAHGGLSTPIVHHSGKARVDFRHGDAVTGAGDGQSDDIPAMLADGEFVFPADVVAAIGNGSTKAGSDKLYDMMHGIRAHVRSAKPKDLPPEIKSPLDFLKTKPKKARR